MRGQGVIKDLAPIDVPEERYTDSLNMIVRDGYQARIEGLADVFGTQIGPPVWMMNVLTPSVSFWMYATDGDEVGVTDGVTHSDITPTIGPGASTLLNRWTGSMFNGVPVFNSGAGDTPWFWNTSPGSVAVPLTGWPANAFCAALRTHGNFIMALDYTDGGGNHIETLVKWSDSAAPGEIPSLWDPSPSNDAGDLSLAATPGAVIDGLSLRNSFIVYKQGSTYAMDSIGGQFIFSQRPLFLTSGILSRNCVVEFNGRHAVLTDGDFVVHDGHQIQSVIDSKLRRYIFDNISADNFQAAFVVLNKPRSEIWICFPTGSNTYADQAVVWSYEDNEFGIRELYNTPFAAPGIMPDLTAGATDWDSQVDTWAASAGTWNASNFNPSEDALVLTDLVNGFYQVDIGTQFVLADIGAQLNKDSMDFGDPELVKTLRAVWPRIDGVSGDVVNVSVGAQMNQNDPITFSAPVPFVIGTDKKVDTFAVGRLLSFRFTSTGGASWRTSGFDAEFGARSAY